MRYLFSLLFLATLFAGCGDGASIAEQEATEAAQKQAYETMMEAHDRIMPMMGKVAAVQRSLMEEMKTEGLSEERTELLNAANEQLEDANDQMMEWMSNMKPLDKLREDMDSDKILQYIKDESGTIAKVETAITAAIAAGSELVGNSHSHDGGDHSHDHGDGHDHDHDH